MPFSGRVVLTALKLKKLKNKKKQLNKKELEVTVSAAVPIKQVQETLSVTTELGNRGEEPLYEPVSPTPLPDSPCDEAKPAAVVEEKAVDCSPFAEVINKKDGVSSTEEEHTIKSNKRTKKVRHVLIYI